MSELRSKCCGAKVRGRLFSDDALAGKIDVAYMIEEDKNPNRMWICSECEQPTEVEEKEEGGK